MSVRKIVFFLLILQSCQNSPRVVSPAFYHWQTKLALTPEENAYLENLRAKKIYAKFFDVDWDFVREEAVPKATVQINRSVIEELEIIPTVFITNRTFSQIGDDAIPDLVTKILSKIEKLSSGLSVQEIQMDCDWTQTTRLNYFTFLDQLKNRLRSKEWQLSVTIRLHQFKYPDQTGIPPAHRGMLMVYNVGDLENWPEQNSILSISTLQPYLGTLNNYPLELDVALPIFAWGVVYRGPKMIKLINNLRAEMLIDLSGIKQIRENRFELVKSTYINGYYLYKGDRIRTEAINFDLLLETAALLSSYNPTNELTLSFYHLDTSTIKFYKHEQLQQVISTFEY